MSQEKINLSAYKIFVMTLIVILGAAPQVQAEPWTCEDALYVCAALNLVPFDSTGLFRCMMGYSFCIDYIKQHLK